MILIQLKKINKGSRLDYEELVKNGKILPEISDVVFKKIMVNHKDYLGLILENCTPLKKRRRYRKG